MNQEPRPGMTRLDWAIAVGGCLAVITIPLWVGLIKLAVS